MNILVPFDFSKSSEKALDVAVQHINAYSGKINLLHVVNDENSLPESSFSIEDVEEKEVNAISTFVNAYCEKNNVAHAIINVEILYGVPSDIINVESEKYDLIIMGTHNKSDWYFRFLGSVSDSTITNAKVPVILVPETIDANKNINKILFAIDDSTNIKTALDKFIVYNNKLKAHVDFTHFEDNVEKSSQNISEIEHTMATTPHEFSYAVKIVDTTDTLGSLSETLKNGAYNLLVMVKRNKGMFFHIFGSSFTRKTIHLGYVPTMIYKES
jgi:nucleotide-binding universal stress UspA family protein